MILFTWCAVQMMEVELRFRTSTRPRMMRGRATRLHLYTFASFHSDTIMSQFGTNGSFTHFKCGVGQPFISRHLSGSEKCRLQSKTLAVLACPFNSVPSNHCFWRSHEVVCSQQHARLVLLSCSLLCPCFLSLHSCFRGSFLSISLTVCLKGRCK